MGKTKKPTRISAKIRFEVLQRDSFTCQYCGAEAPDALLEVDHVKPRFADGDDDPLNLVTSCKTCNIGKGRRKLTDGALLKRRKAQLDGLQERKEQLDLMLEWEQKLLEFKEKEKEMLKKYINSKVIGFCASAIINEPYLDSMFEEILTYCTLRQAFDGVDITASTYLDWDSWWLRHKRNSARNFYEKLPGVCYHLAHPSNGKEINKVKKVIDELYNRGVPAMRIGESIKYSLGDSKVGHNNLLTSLVESLDRERWKD